MRRKTLTVATKKFFKLSLTLVAISTLAFMVTSKYENLASSSSESNYSINHVGHGDINTLKAAFDVWRENYETKGGSAEVLKLSLGYSKVLSEEFTTARGQMQLDLKDGALTFKATGLSPGKYGLWAVDNQNGSAKPEVGDNMLLLGSFEAADNKGFLKTRLERSKLLGFTMDSLVLAREGRSPVEGVVIAGAPDLMHKLYYADKPWLTTAMGDFNTLSPEESSPFDFLLPKAAQAGRLAHLKPVLGDMIAKGRQIFHNETFEGNGRTCGTCHRADNNFTLDPNYIMTLPSTDPLFVAETNPDLADLENPVLMRKHALIKTNVDGPDVDIFRSVPHTLSMATSAKSETLEAGGEFAADEAFANATGWSGDGAPGSGSLREFTLGAIAQHMTKSLSRISGTDFRVPTEEELDAIEAYTLSLGRSKDYPVYQISFKDPLLEMGKELFDTKTNPVDGDGVPILGETANCNGCHQNAGARSSTTKANPTRDTGIEKMKIHPARLLKEDMAYDGGFGQEAANCGPNADQACYGDGRFSTPPLIEAADTAPFFHNNAVSTLEEAIAAYNSDAFNTSPGHLSKITDRSIKLDSTQIVAIASFLRAINALENIRLSDQLDNQAKMIPNLKTARELAKLGAAENQDAIEVLKEGKLGTNWQAALKLEKAAKFQKLARLSPVKSLRNRFLNKALDQKKQARELIASCDPNAAVPATVKVPTPTEEFLYTCAEIGL